MSRPTTVPLLACVALTAALLTGGCGSATDAGSTSTSSSTSSATPAAAYPITIERSGGLAGFADKVVVAQDGTAKVTTKSGTSTCTVAPETLTALARTASGATPGTTAPSPQPDALAVTLTTSQGSVVLDEGDLPGTAPEVGALLEDLAKPKDQRTTCR